MKRTNTLFEVQDNIATLTIDRPKKLNALNAETLEEIEWSIEEIKNDPSIKALIITGAGSKSFVAGADISAMPNYDPKDAYDFSVKGSNLCLSLEALPIPVVAAVNGFAFGGGCELALACDFIYASNRALFGQPEVKLGLIAGYGGTQRLPRKIGYGRAMELLMSGDNFTAKQAESWGMVNKVVPQEDLLPAVRKTLSRILRQSSTAVALSKEAVVNGTSMSLKDGLAVESNCFAKAFQSENAKEGIAAFLNKRKPNFK